MSYLTVIFMLEAVAAVAAMKEVVEMDPAMTKKEPTTIRVVKDMVDVAAAANQ
jgi:hypothetical protein